MTVARCSSSMNHKGGNVRERCATNYSVALKPLPMMSHFAEEENERPKRYLCASITSHQNFSESLLRSMPRSRSVVQAAIDKACHEGV